MIKTGICWCQPGMMSQCVASNIADQTICDFHASTDETRKCMHKRETLNDHCDCPAAQRYAAEYGVITPNDIGIMDREEEEIILDLGHIDQSPRSCDQCILYTCSYVIKENQAAYNRGGLTMGDLEIIAGRCEDYCDEDMMNQRTKQSLRGYNP